MSEPLPPRWADRLLRIAVRPADRDAISGDLIEEYRDRIVPLRGRWAADCWYVVQMLGYVWRAAGLWAVVFSGVFLTRTAYDWLVPTTEFVTRSTVTTILAAGTLSTAGFVAAWRHRSVVSAVLLTVITSQLAAVLSVLGVTAMLIVWHDDATARAINGSGGLAEAFTLPFSMIVPAVVLGALGGACGSVVRTIVR